MCPRYLYLPIVLNCAPENVTVLLATFVGIGYLCMYIPVVILGRF